MEVCYVIGKNSRTDNFELRMSLRSLCKYANGLGKVIVAGYPPAWLSNEVEKVSVADKYSYKHSNILLCLEEVVRLGLVQGDFLYSSDDHFYIRPVDFSCYPFYIKADKLREKITDGDPHYQYHKSLFDTRELLCKHGFPAKNYSQHCNTHMNTAVIRDYADIIHESYKLPFGVEPTSLVMNLWSVRKGFPTVEKRADVKINKAENMADVWAQIGDRDCFSTGDDIMKSGPVRQILLAEFPDRCRFEKG